MEVAVAMSGGVDSSVAAALLLNRGYSVKGMMLRLWSGEPDVDSRDKKIQHAIDRAQQVSEKLKIPFEVIDAVDPFKKMIVEYFIQSHQAGRTPNPCFVCNRLIKWGLLMVAAIQSGAELMATGHYARLVQNAQGIVELYKGIDISKDQSYVLAGLSQEQLSRAILPLGEFTKTEIRKIAHSYNFTNYDQPDSQDLCFLGGMNHDDFLAIYAPESQVSGEIRTTRGEVVGIHHGLSNYTIGQRKGLGAGFKEPIYVLDKLIGKNELIVGTKSELGVKRIDVEEINWIDGCAPETPMQCGIKIRYKAKPVDGLINKDSNNKYSIVFTEKVRDATPGQFAVFYDGDRVVGSGVIDKIYGEEV